MKASNVLPFKPRNQKSFARLGVEWAASYYAASLHLYAAGWSVVLGSVFGGKNKQRDYND